MPKCLKFYSTSCYVITPLVGLPTIVVAEFFFFSVNDYSVKNLKKTIVKYSTVQKLCKEHHNNIIVIIQIY